MGAFQAPECLRGKALRVLAFAICGQPVPTKDRDGRKLIIRQDPFDCVKWCGDGARLPPAFDAVRASRRCTLPGFWRPWTETRYEDHARLSTWQGAEPVERDGFLDPHPPEPIEHGCPGGWARSRFASSFAKYIRPRVEGGGHDHNPRVSADTPGHILDALAYFETYQAKAEADFRRRAG